MERDRTVHRRVQKVGLWGQLVNFPNDYYLRQRVTQYCASIVGNCCVKFFGRSALKMETVISTATLGPRGETTLCRTQ